MAGIDFTYRHRLRLIHVHTHRMIVVSQNRYVDYIEAGAPFLRPVGNPYGQLKQQGTYLPVVESPATIKTCHLR